MNREMLWASNLAHRSCLQYLLDIGLPIQVLGMTENRIPTKYWA